MITKISEFKMNESLSDDRVREARLQILIDTARQMIENYKKAEEFEELKKAKNEEVKAILDELNKTSVIAEGVLIEVIKPFKQKRLASKAYFDFIETSVGTISEDFRALSNEIKAASMKMSAEKEYIRTNKNTRNKETGELSEGITDIINKVSSWVSSFVSRVSGLLNKTNRDLDVIMAKAKRFSSVLENAFSHSNPDYETIKLTHPFFQSGTGYAVIYKNQSVGFVYQLNDYWCAWSTYFDIDNIDQFLDECVQGMHDTEGASSTADTMEEAIDELVYDLKESNINEIKNTRYTILDLEKILFGLITNEQYDAATELVNETLTMFKRYMVNTTGGWKVKNEIISSNDNSNFSESVVNEAELTPEEERRLRRNRASRDSHARRREQNKKIENVLVKAKEAIALAQEQTMFEELAKSQEKQVIELLKEFNSKSVAIDNVILTLIRTESKPVLDMAEYENKMTNAEEVGDAVALMTKALIEIHKNTVEISGSVRQYKDDSESPEGTFNARFDWENKTVVPPSANEGIGDYMKNAWNTVKRFFLRFKMASKRLDNALANIVA